MDAGESRLIDLMTHIVEKYAEINLFSLPKLDERRTTELGVKGVSAQVQTALAEIKQAVTALGFPWSDV